MTTTAMPSIGASSAALTWDAIEWQTAERQVRRLQMRIAKATNRVRRLAFERLERRDEKSSCAVLRGGSGREAPPLPGSVDAGLQLDGLSADAPSGRGARAERARMRRAILS